MATTQLGLMATPGRAYTFLPKSATVETTIYLPRLDIYGSRAARRLNILGSAASARLDVYGSDAVKRLDIFGGDGVE